MIPGRRGPALIVVLAVAAACAGSDEAGSTEPTGPTPTTGSPTTITLPPSTGAPSTVAPTSRPIASTAPPAPPAGDAPPDASSDAVDLVAALAGDALGGRDNGSAGSAAARDLIVAELERFAEPAGRDGWLQPFDAGVNVLGTIAGRGLADEYVIVGAHYDHLGPFGCNGVTEIDDVCNGAADNAAGVAAALVVARTVAASSPRRSIIVALWDAEEDGLLGAEHYLTDPVVPIEQTVAYVNLDILGANLVPSLADRTVAIGAETGGARLVDATATAAESSPLTVATLSLLFGQGRSDHAPFARAGVPVVFFTDATNGCYHTVDDELERLDLAKLDAQIALATRLTDDLASTDDPPAFDGDAPVASYGDAVSLLDLLDAGRDDLALLGEETAAVEALIAEVEAVVAAGEAEFGDDDLATVLGAAATLIDLLDDGPCP